MGRHGHRGRWNMPPTYLEMRPEGWREGDPPCGLVLGNRQQVGREAGLIFDFKLCVKRYSVTFRLHFSSILARRISVVFQLCFSCISVLKYF